MKIIELDGHSLTCAQVIEICRGAEITLSPEAEKAVTRAARVVSKKVADGEVVYGVTTGFGNNADKLLPDPEKARMLQRNLLITHAVGVGKPLDETIVRALMAIRINTLIQGHSGIRLTTVRKLAQMLNAGVLPWIPEKGSVGASGDLAPLSHMAMVLIGGGQAYYKGKLIPGAQAMKAAGIEPVNLAHKEGLALNNGTALMLAYGVLTLHHMGNMVKLADIAAAMTMEGLAGRADALRAEIHELRHHPGQMATAENLRRLVKGSDLVDIPYEEIPKSLGGWTWNREMDRIEGGKAFKPQDSYCVRCVPQVHGAVKDTLQHVQQVMTREMNAVTDNPIVLPRGDEGEGDVISAGNFHGMPLALALSFLKTAIPTLASISERRANKLVDPATSDGLPPFLVRNDDNTDSGFMIVQYTSASLVNDLASRAMPASVYSIPTSANQEDHVSMGATEGRHVYAMLDDLRRVLALEIYTAGQAIDIRTKTLDGTFWGHDDWLNDVPETDRKRLKTHADEVRARAHKSSPAVAAVMAALRENVDYMDTDREMAPDITAVLELSKGSKLVEIAEQVIGPLALASPLGAD
ncbi:MAG: histidine ammonia-lyase [Acidobacteriota bacterium]|nr:histidine ammonia-lyase [Acidobacteriota bacterium]